MAVTCGFFNSKSGDRKYDAEQVSSLFDGVIIDGVYMTVGNRFNVAAGDGMSVTVDTGRAWFNHTWTLNDAKLILGIDKQVAPLHRIDSIVLKVNHALDYRVNTIEVVKGTAAQTPSAPALNNTSETFYYKFADVYVKNTDEASAISNSDITNYIGTSICPYVTGPLKSVSADQILQQWNSQWRDELNTQSTSFKKKYNELSAYIGGAQDQWNTWFSNIKYTLSGDAAGKLQVEIDKINGVAEITLDKNKWTSTSDGKFTQTVSLPGVTSSSIIDIRGAVKSTMTSAKQKAYIKAYSIVSCGYSTLGTDTITFYVYKKPATTITIKIKGGSKGGSSGHEVGNIAFSVTKEGLLHIEKKEA